MSLILILTTLLAADPQKITYTDHVRAVLREHCFSCHNQNRARNDLALDSYERIIKGGASGEAIKPGDPDESLMYRLMTHQDEPKMPPAMEKLPAAKLELIRQWIAGGALKDSGSKAVQAKPKLDLAMASGAARPAGAPILPVGVARQTLVQTARPGAVTGLATSPWAPLLAVAGQKQIALYHLDKADLLGVLPFPEGTAHVLKFSRSGALLLAGGGHAARQGRVVVFDVKTGKRLFELGDELDAVRGADINSTHSRVALGGPDRILRVFATAEGSVQSEIKKHTDWILAVEYSPDGVLLASADRAGGLVVWEADSMQEYQNLEGHQGPVTDVSWRPDSNVLASASGDGTIRLWEMNDGRQIRSITAHPGGVLSVQFAHDGRLVSAGRDNRVKLWAADGKLVRQFGPMPDLALRAAISDDATRVIGGDWSGRVQIWQAADGRELTRLTTTPR